LDFKRDIAQGLDGTALDNLKVVDGQQRLAKWHGVVGHVVCSAVRL
jgi:hypothetical protein